jgi:flagellum-specific ATP synthase
MESALHLEKYSNALNDVNVTHDIGKVTEVSGLLVKGYVTGCGIGSICEINTLIGHKKFLAEVVGFKGRDVLLMPLKETHGVGHGSKISLLKTKATVAVGDELLGRIVNGLGEPIDGLGDIDTTEEVPLYQEAVGPMSRAIIDQPLSVGVRAIDGLITAGRGQRVGIMAGSGVGKSMLMGMMARTTEADVNVIALIGERGREVKEFIEHSLGEEGLKRSIVVAVTSDQSPLIRMRGAFVATAIAEHFASEGKSVLLVMDSVTRFAMAQREIGLSAGEPPASKGYTPSVFSLLPKLLERAGSFANGGSITGFYTVLVEGDDMDEPIADAVRSIVDGHIVLDRKIAHRGHFPAIDVLKSTSRVMRGVVSKEHVQLAQFIRENMATFQEAEDLINIGAYRSGANPKIDQAIQYNERIAEFLKQDVNEPSHLSSTVDYLASIAGGAR